MNMEEAFESEGLNEVGQNVEQFEAPDISEDEMSEHVSNILADALHSTELMEVVQVSASVVQCNILARVKKDNEKEVINEIVKPLLDAAESYDDMDIFVGKQYILKSGKVLYGWLVSVTADDLKKSIYTVCQILDDSIPKVEVMESPLMGPSTPQITNVATGRRGAAPLR